MSLPKKNGKRGEELSDDSKNKVLSCLSEIMDEAVRLELVKDNPCRKVQEIIARGVPREIFNEEEMAVLFPENDAEAVWVWRSLMWACYFHIMKCTGFRPGEIAGLRRENYYPELKGVFTTSSVNSGTHKFVNRIKTTGSGKEYKVGLLSDQCCRLLDKYIATLPGAGHALPHPPRLHHRHDIEQAFRDLCEIRRTADGFRGVQLQKISGFKPLPSSVLSLR